MNYKPKVSIIINCYNGAEFLEEAINSVISQTYRNWELIFWDNVSTDGSSSIFKKYKDDRFHYFLAKKHTLLYEARDLAIKKTKGDLIAFLDADDWWEKDKLELQINSFSNEKIGLSCTNFWIVNQKKNKSHIAFRNGIPEKNKLDYFLKNNFVNISTLIFRKKTYLSLEYGFDHDYEMIGDFDLVVRFLLVTELAFINRPLVSYRWHNNNLSNKKLYLNNQEKFNWLKKFESNPVLNKNPSYEYFYNKIKFYQIMNLIYMNKRYDAFIKISSVKTIKYKILSTMIVFIPLFILKLLRS